MAYALAPIQYSLSIANTNMKLLGSALNGISDVFNKIRTSVDGFVKEYNK